MPTTIRNLLVGTLASGALVAVGAWAGLGAPGVGTLGVQLAVVLAASAAMIVYALERARKEVGRVDYLHPLVFPLFYVAVSFVFPAWLAFVQGHETGSLQRNVRLHEATPSLMLLAVAGFAGGVALALRLSPVPPRRDEAVAEERVLAPDLALAGRCTLLAAVGIGIWDITSGGVAVRATGQGVYEGVDSLRVALKLLPLAGAVLVGLAHRMSERPGLLPPVDIVLVMAVVTLSTLLGDRNITISTLLALLVLLGQNRVRLVSLGMIMALLGVFMVGALQYRNEAMGRTVDKTAVEAIAADLAPASFSTGAVAAAVPEQFSYLYGDTLKAAAVRQLPSPVAVRLIGPPHDTAAYRFRSIIGYQSRDGGVGFSIPAEGYLNFGLPGMVGLTAAVGGLVGWAYRRFDPRRGRTTAVLYPIVVATLPFGLRADMLGAGKAVLYPALLIALTLLIARSRRNLAHAVTRPGRTRPELRR